MGKSKHVGNKHLYIGTSKNPKRMDMVPETIDNNIWKKEDKGTYNLMSFSYTIFAKGRRKEYAR